MIFIKLFISTKYHFDLSKVKDSKTHKQRNRQLSSSRIHSISVKFIKETYITISNIIRSYICPECYQSPDNLKYKGYRIL